MICCIQFQLSKVKKRMEIIWSQLNPLWKILFINFLEEKTITKKQKFINVLKKFGFIIQLLNIVFFALLNLPIFRNKINWEQILYQSSIGFTLCYCFIVYLNTFNKRFDIGHTQKLLSELNVNNKSQWIKYGFDNDIQKFHKFSRIFRKYFYFCLAITLIKEIYDIFRDSKKSLIKFPYDVKINQILTFAWIWITKILICVISEVSYMIFCAFVNNLCIEFEILKNNLKEWGKKRGSHDALKELILRHNQLLLIAENLNKIYGLKLFSNFIVSSFVICFNAFQMIITNQPLTFIVNILVCIGSLTVNGIQCYYGQKLIDASEKVADVIYDIAWENLESITVKKILFFMLMRSQKPASLSILKFSNVTLKQFGKVI